MFEMLIREVAAKFGLGDKAGSILSELLGLMFQKQSGGLGGLLALFNKKGLASIASTWLGGASGLKKPKEARQSKSTTQFTRQNRNNRPCSSSRILQTSWISMRTLSGQCWILP